MKLKQAMTRLISNYHGQGAAVLLFDYDGTLAPIVSHPRYARMTPGMRRAIERLTRHPGIAVGILSGRSLSDLREIVGLPGAHLVGLCGLELDLCGDQLSHPRARQGRELIATLTADLRNHLQAWEQAWVEDKSLGLTVHYRAVPQAETAELLRRTTRMLDRFQDRIQVKQCALAIEVVPAFGCDKGTAVHQVVKRLGWHNPLVLFAGDSPNDEEAFQAVDHLQGITIGIGTEAPSIAQYRLESPAALESLLTNLNDILTQQRTKKTRQPPIYQAWEQSRPFFPLGPM